MLAALQIGPETGSRVRFVGDERWPSCFPVTDLAAASIGAAACAVSELVAIDRPAPNVTVDRRLASLWFFWSIDPIGWELPSPWDAIAGDYETADGWIKLHTNAPHHRAAALTVLGPATTRDEVARAVRSHHGESLEQAIVEAAGCAALLRTTDDWRAHPQGGAVAAEPLVIWDREVATDRSIGTASIEHPLHGVRVLDLTRVIAGPVATRLLAGFGAEVLRIDPPTWDEPGVVPEVTLGKRCAQLDLHDDADRTVFERLLADADVVVHGYRSDALERLGYGTDARQAIRPGIIDVSLDAYGHTGPWAQRRGFDSLVQFSTGIAAAGMAWQASDHPVSLPVQALDHATGYLVAAAVTRSIASVRRDGVAPCARLSLARTAHALIEHRDEPTDATMSPLTEADYQPTTEPTSWGAARRLRPPVEVAGTPLHWSRPARALGSSVPAWESTTSRSV